MATSNKTVLELNAMVCAKVSFVILSAGISPTATAAASKSAPFTYDISIELPSAPGYLPSNAACTAVFPEPVVADAAVAPLSARDTNNAFAYER